MNENLSLVLTSLLLLQTASVECAERPPRGGEGNSPSVGDFSRKETLVFAGNATFTGEEIRSALALSWGYQLAAHPAAPLDEYLAKIERGVTLGYERAGFPKVTVKAMAETNTSRIVVRIDEGPRYRCGEVLLSGAAKLNPETVRKTIAEAIARPVNPAPGRKGKLASITESPSDPDSAPWVRNKPVRFDESSVDALRSVIQGALEELAYDQPKPSIQIVPDPARKLADLRIEITEEGLRRTLQEIEVTGLRTNSRQQVLEFLKLAPGLVMRGDLVRSVSNQLWQSGRFYRNEVRLAPLAAAGDWKLELDLEELQAAPPLGRDFPPEARALLKLREWLMDWEQRGEDLVFSLNVSNSWGRTNIDLVCSRSGLVVAVRVAPSNNPPALTAAVVASTERTLGFYSCWSGRWFVCPSPEGGASLLIGVDPNPDVEGEQRFGISIGAGILAIKGSQPLRVKMKLSPAAFVKLAFEKGLHSAIKDGVLTVTKTNATDDGWLEAKVDAVTGRLIEGAFGEDTLRFRLRCEAGAYAGLLKEIAATTANHPNQYVTNHGLSSWLSFVATDLIESPLIEPLLKEVFARALPEHRPTDAQTALLTATLPQVRALLTPERLAGLFAPLDGLFSQERAEAADGFGVPAFPSTDSEANPEVQSLAAIALAHGDRLLPRDTWLWVLWREAGFTLAGENRYTETELNKLLNSDDIGPVGCLAAASLLGSFKPQYARLFAERGLSRLNAPTYQKDYRVLLQTNAILGQIFQRGFGLFRGLSSAQVTALTSSLNPEDSAFLRESARLIRDAPPNQASGDAAWPAFEQHWEKTVQRYLATGLKQFLSQVQSLTESQALFERGLALTASQAETPEFEEAAQLFRKAAEQGHAGAQLRLGSLYESGQGVRQDFDEAMRWYRKAAEQKEPHATCRIAELFREGKGVHKDLDEAAKWYRTEAEGECTGAQVNLARIYDQQNNTAEALKYYRRGAERGNVVAQAYLGDFLSNGLFTTPDYVEACQWLILAAQAQTNRVMEFSLRRLRTKLSPDQLKEAEKRAEAVTRRQAEREKDEERKSGEKKK